MNRFLALVALALVLLAPAAHAAPYCKVPAAKYIHAGQVGENWYLYWWCEGGGWGWTPLIPAEFTSDRLVAAHAWALGLNPGYPSTPSYPPADDPRVKELYGAAYAMAASDTDRPPAPPAEKWVVQKNAAYTTRPTYPVTDGQRGSKSDGRAAVGAACDCARPIVETKTTWCAVPPSASVAVCVRAPPEAPAAAPPTAAPGLKTGAGAAGKTPPARP